MDMDTFKRNLSKDDLHLYDFAIECISNCEDRTILKDSLLPRFHKLTEKQKGKLFCFFIGVIKQLTPKEEMK